ncbi:hypothetical protein MWU54_01470 [Marivita sp. S6314]|uniref:hypothetical protein n=1 Tax=Marivita sp. S6314 TaxID=2926406 RepID=UPI001FF1CC3F|nr:hypothetical protein [Marivita sp. S6314]MCK0148679.1 hypothetical protein [Marivita sp. S6314]
MADLHADLLAAHATGDPDALVASYVAAADQQDEIEAVCFFLTNAYVFALEAGHPRTGELRERLAAHGRV